MLQKNVLLFPVFSFCTIFAFSQDSCFTAGKIIPGFFTDIPDKSIFECCYQPPAVYDLDLDHDGTIDFQVVDWYRNYSAGSNGYAYIEGKNGNKVLASGSGHMADTLDSGDSICTTGMWVDKAYLIDYNFSFGYPASSYDYPDWEDRPGTFAGLRFSSVLGKRFGWVQVYATSYSATITTIKDFGYSGATLQPPASEGIVFFPNPTTNFVNIYLPNYTEYEVRVCNALGEIIYKKYGNPKFVDLSVVPPGLYTITVITNDKTYSDRIVRAKDPNN
jgi:hypothetical protein